MSKRKRARRTQAPADPPGTPTPADAPSQRTAVGSFEAVGLGACLLYFCVKAFYFCFWIREGIFPDEVTHLGRVQLFSKSLLIPADSVESYPLGLIAHVPNLYYFLLGKCLALNVFGLSELVFLRVVNVLLGLLALVYGWRLVRLLSRDPAVRLLFMVMLTNTLMFTFISAAVNYDNLVNLLAVGSLFYLVRHVRFDEAGDSVLCGVLLLAGTLTKSAFLPYAFLMCLVWLFEKRKNLTASLAALGSHLSPLSAKKAIAACFFLLLLILNVSLYGTNVVRYGHIIPRADQVLTLEQAMQNRIFARNRVNSLYRRGEISIAEAREMAQQIRHAGDRADTLHRLRVAESEKTRPRPRQDRFTYAFPWANLISGRIYGVAAHKMIWRTGSQLVAFHLVFLLGLVACLRKFRSSDMHGLGKYLLFVFGAYALVLMQLVNYKNYLATGVLGAALQGRYLFVVIAPCYALLSFYLVSVLPGRWRWAVAGAVALIFVLGEFPWFLHRVSSDWFF